MWLDNLKELKSRSGMSPKQIAEKTNLPERTVIRIFAGETDNPYADTLHRIVAVLGGSLDDILTDSKVVVGGKDLVTLQETLDAVTAERDKALMENATLKEQFTALSAEADVLKVQLKHKEEIMKCISSIINLNN